MRVLLKDNNFVIQKKGHRNYYLIKDDKNNNRWIDRETLYSFVYMGAITNVILKENKLSIINPHFILLSLDKNLHNRLVKYLDWLIDRLKKLAKEEQIDEYYLYEDLEFYEYWKDYEKALKKANETQLVMYGNSFCGLVGKRTEFGLEYVNYSSFTTDASCTEEMVYAFLVKKYKKALFSMPEAIRNMTQIGLKYCNFKSSINPEYEYNFYTRSLCSLNPNVLRDIVESQMKQRRDQFDGKLFFKCYKPEELEKKFGKIYEKEYTETWTTHNGNLVLTGFHYFNIGELTSYWNRGRERFYLTAEDKDGNILGVIKYGYYGEGASRHLALSFVDVHVLYRRLGIATKLLSEMNKYVDKGELFELSMESEMGKKCHMHNLAKSLITNAKVITDEEYREEQYRLLYETNKS